MTRKDAIKLIGLSTIGFCCKKNNMPNPIINKVVSLAGNTGGAASYNSATESLLAAMSVQPSSSFKSILDTAIVALKSDGTFDSHDFFNVLGMQDEQSSTLNWINPSANVGTKIAPYQHTPYWGIVRNGGVGNGYRNTNFNPATHCVQATKDSSCFWIFFNYTKKYNGVSQFNGAQDDTVSPTRNAMIRSQIISAGTTYVTTWLNEPVGVLDVDSSNGLGLLLVETEDTTHNKDWLNDVLLATNSATRADLINRSLFMLGINYNGSYYTSPNESQIYATGFSKKLTTGQKTNLFNSLNTFRRANLLGTSNLSIDTNKCLIIGEMGESTGTKIFDNLDAEVNASMPNVYNWISSGYEQFIPATQANYAHDGSGTFSIAATMNYKLSTTYGRKVRYLNKCVGGTTIYNGDDNWYLGKTKYNAFVVQMLAAIAAATETTKDVCVIIRLGINDSFDSTRAAAFQADLIATIAQLRTDLSRPTLKIFLNRLSANLDGAYKSTINTAIDYIIANDTNVHGYNTDDYVYQTDLHHQINSSAMDAGYRDADLIISKI